MYTALRRMPATSGQAPLAGPNLQRFDGSSCAVSYNSIGRIVPTNSSMTISKKIEFCASHVCRSPQLSDAENERLYGAAANPLGHGHNYVVEVSVEGRPDPVTGMILDLKRLKEL